MKKSYTFNNYLFISATFGNPNAGGGINNGAAAIKLESHSSAGSGNGSNYYTCATYGSPSPGAQEHHQQQQGLLATSAYSKFTVFQRTVLEFAPALCNEHQLETAVLCMCPNAYQQSLHKVANSRTGL